ncbi:MAG: STT3 domain-containing protein [Desulfobacteraceae bacterium]|jgi:dolichyl-diphosphooligosaccharide--protein glycosyltransferase
MIHWICLILILFLAFWLRMDDLLAWSRHPSKAFYKGQPLLTAFDGYYYLSLARDIQNRTYTPLEQRRGVPDPQKRPWPPPLISILSAAISTTFSISLNWAAALLPPILGLGLAVPLYLFGRLYGGGMMALVASCVGLCSNYCVYRSNLGWFDTDCLNVAFALFIAYAFICFGLEQGRKRFLHLAAGLLTYGVFLLWWDQARPLVSLMVLSMLALVVIFYYRPKGRERWVSILAALCIISALMLWGDPQAITMPFKKVSGTFDYISNKQTGDFPNTSQSVYEQKNVTFKTLVQKTTANSLTLAMGIIGLVWMCIRHKGKVSALLLWLAIGCGSLIFARRFLIFLNPFIALGLGFVVQQGWNLRHRKAYLKIVAPICAGFFCFFPVKASFTKVYWPKEIPAIISGFDAASKQTPSNAVIWAWWDHGYPMLYWAQRSTINDGSLHSGERTVCNAIPMAAPSQRLSANFIHFYTTRGLKGLHRVFGAVESASKGMHWIEKILNAGPQHAAPLIAEAGLSPVQQWHEFFFPKKNKELYLFLDQRMAHTTYWWYWFGTWDIEKHAGTRGQFRFIYDVRINANMVQGRDIEADLAKGLVTYRHNTYPLTLSFITGGADQTRTRYSTDQGLVLAVHKKARTAALMDQTFSRSTFNQLFGLCAPNPAYFELIAENYPFYQIWKVTPDEVFQQHDK